MPWLRASLLLAVAALLLPSAGCANNAEKPGPIEVVQNPGFARQWATGLKFEPGDRAKSLFVRDTWLFVYTKNGYVYGLKRVDGEPEVSMKIPSGDFRLFPPVLLKESMVFPTTTALEIYSLEGAHLRTLEIGDAIRAEPVGERANVFVPVSSADGGARIKHYDLNHKTVNVPMWELQASRGGIASTPALHTDTIYMAAETGTVYAVATETREPIWNLGGTNVFDARSPVVAPLRADDVGLYISTVEGKFYCINRTSGAVKWQWYASGPLETAPIPLADTVYIRDPNRGWAAVDKVENPEIKTPQHNRKERWIRDDVIQILSQDDRYTYVALKNNHIAALDKKTGATKFESRRSDFSIFATNTRDSTIYTCSTTGRVVAVKAVLQPGFTGEVVRLDEDKSPEGEVAAAGEIVLYAVQ